MNDQETSQDRVEAVLVDTDVFVWLLRGSAQQVARYEKHVEGKRIALSFATVAELWQGAYVRGYNDESRRKLSADIDITLVIPPTQDLAHEWAELTAKARELGHALGADEQKHDAWIAATSRLYDLPILSDDSDLRDAPHTPGFPALNLIVA